ncbi:MAG: DNA-directed DNA polymerase II small subunit [Candidatus ainarchaeum sp.]|nr:DNA-directed DNA polymerase II small subunit [Candidatus ainarchaeum sp.]
MDNEIIKYAKENNLILTPETLKHLSSDNYKEILNKLKEKNLFIVKEKDVLDVKNQKEEKKYFKNFYILDKYDITGKNYSQGSIEDFHKLFLDKYEKISKMIKTRPNFEYTTIEQARLLVKGKPADVIGMVYDKGVSKNGNLILTIDDPTGQIKLVIMNKDENEFFKHKEILLDNVLGFKTSLLSKDMLIVNEVIYPDIPFERKTHNLPKDVYLTIIGDVHVGSKKFKEKEFLKFIEWLNGNFEDEKELTKKIKYLVIAGDLVDGIGVYPTQFNELAITDIKKQYELFEEYILKIREDIEIFIISGNHDAVRLSDPQPAITKEYLPRLYEKENIHILGSPAWVVIEGFKTLMYHGASLHGIYTEIKNAKMDKPDTAMIEVLKRRDLMPQYGNRQTFVPIEKNLMVIEEVPDIFITADVHHHAYSKYKHVHLIASSCWQDMTDFQKELGHVPTVSKALLFNLKTEELLIKDFLEKEI